MSLCPDQSSFTPQELKDSYTTTPALLSSESSEGERDGTGMLKDSVIADRIKTLRGSGIIPTPSPSNPEQYLAKQQTFLVNVKAEYCYYDSRYKYALQQLFAAIGKGYPTSTPEIQKNINDYLTKTQDFNRRLNDLTQIMNATVSSMMVSSSDVDREIIQYNAQIQEKQKKLDEQNRIITSSEAGANIKKQMVKYTEEKARNTNNLLNLYAFLNVVTLGLLVYVYKAAGDS